MDTVNPEASLAPLSAALAAAKQGLVDRGVLVDLVVLSAVAGEHALVIGPPGTAKSQAVRRIANALGGQYFEYLLGRFTEPNEIFGPVDLARLREGVVETLTTGMLPEAEIAFLDEVFQGSSAILNTLLGILQERRFRRGLTMMDCPLRICVAASNQLPEDPSLEAFADRFLVRVFVDRVPDPSLDELLASGWTLTDRLNAVASVNDLRAAHEAMRAVDLAAVRPLLAAALRELRGAGIVLSDRRAVKCQRLIAAAATLAGRAVASNADLWPVIYALPTLDQQTLAQEKLRAMLAASDNATLPSAAEDASAGPLARARRIEKAGHALLAARPAQPDHAWQLQLEGVAREIDATFHASQMPEAIAALRRSLVAELRA
ncbi:MAG: AAA family ATPase [Bryobacterales bacterium]|nr:AAA family ATPase [Bryobacterales bacterium]